jgi:hypothetical protein
VADRPDLDPGWGVFKWSWHQAKAHRRQWWVGGIVYAGLTAAAALLIPTDWGTKGEIAGMALAMATVAVVVLSLGYAVLVAPYEQRATLRADVESLRTEAQYPQRPTLATLATLADLLKRGESLIMSLETTASCLPPLVPGRQTDTKADWYIDASQRIEGECDRLNKWGTECNQTVEQKLGLHNLAIMESWLTWFHTPFPDDLNGWGEHDWAYANQRVEWLRKTIQELSVP